MTEAMGEGIRRKGIGVGRKGKGGREWEGRGEERSKGERKWKERRKGKGGLMVPKGEGFGEKVKGFWCQMERVVVPKGDTYGAKGKRLWCQREKVMVPKGQSCGPKMKMYSWCLKKCMKRFFSEEKYFILSVGIS